MIPLVRKARTLIIYVLLFHVVTRVCDILLPNLHWANRFRGILVGRFFRRSGKRVAIASGCIFNAPWALVVEDDCYIAHRCWLNAVGGLTLRRGVILSPNVVVATTAHGRVDGAVSLRKSRIAPIEIGSGAWVASNSVVTKGSIIGAGAIVGAASVVIGEIQGNALYAGNPAIRIRELDRN